MEDIQIVAFILGFALRIIGIFVCSKKAAELNRNAVGWGIFGLCSPILAMIIVHNLKPKVNWWGEESNPQGGNVNILPNDIKNETTIGVIYEPKKPKIEIVELPDDIQKELFPKGLEQMDEDILRIFSKNKLYVNYSSSSLVKKGYLYGIYKAYHMVHNEGLSAFESANVLIDYIYQTCDGQLKRELIVIIVDFIKEKFNKAKNQQKLEIKNNVKSGIEEQKEPTNKNVELFDKYDKLRFIKELLDDNILTQDEFNKEKQKVLNNEPSVIFAAEKIEILQSIKKLQNEGILTQNEFDKEKQKILEN